MSTVIKYAGATAVSGAAAGVAELTVPDLAALDELDDAALPAGATVRVETLLATWLLSEGTSVPEVDALEVRRARSDAAQWVRQVGGHPAWAARAAFHVHGVDGDDEASGEDEEHPLASVEEVLRRIGQCKVQNTNNWLTIHLHSPVEANPARPWLVFSPHPDAMISVKGYLAAEPTATGTIASLQLVNAATNLEWKFTSVGTTFTEGRGLVRLTNGINAEATAWVARDLGGGVVRTTGWRKLFDYDGVYSLDEAVPVNGNTFAFYSEPLPAYVAPAVYVASGYVVFTDVYFVDGPYFDAQDAFIHLNRCYTDSEYADWSIAYQTNGGTLPKQMDTGKGPEGPYSECCLFRGLVMYGGRQARLVDCVVDGGSAPDTFCFLALRAGQRVVLDGVERGARGGLGLFVPAVATAGIDLQPSCSAVSLNRVFGAVAAGDVVRVHSGAYFAVNGTLYPTATFGAGKNTYHLGENNAAGRFAASAVPSQDPAETGARVIASQY